MKKIIGIFLICFVSLISLTNCASTPKVTDVSWSDSIGNYNPKVYWKQRTEGNLTPDFIEYNLTSSFP